MKIQNLHIVFFYLFLFSIPFQTRKVFLGDYSFYSGAFTEYTTYFLYLSDILLILTLFFWFISAEKCIFDKFRIKNTMPFNFCKVKNCIKILSKWISGDRTWQYLAIFVLILGINLVINRDYIAISFYQFLKVAEMALLLLYVVNNLKTEKILINSLYIIAISGLIQGIFAIWQFVNQSSIFYNSLILRKITGESLIGSDIPGVANFVFEGQKIVRSYGTFPHPNLLGGFLIFTILITVFLYLERKNINLSSKSCANDNNNIDSIKSQGIVYSLFWIILLFVQISALLFTFSRISWIGFILVDGILYLFYIRYFLIVSRETIVDSKFIRVKQNLLFKSRNLKNSPLERGWGVFEKTEGYHQGSCFNELFIRLNLLVARIKKYLYFSNNYVNVADEIVSRETILSKLNNYSKITINFLACYKELFIVCILTLLLIGSNISLIQARIGGDLFSNNNLPNNSAISDRLFYNNVSRETISDNYLFGSGLGTSIFQINGYLKNNDIRQKFKPWQYQPIHNMYFLIASEVGLIGFFIFLLFVGQIIFRSVGNTLSSICISQKYEHKIVSRETILTQKLNSYLLVILIVFLFIGIFDHYFWTLQQGRLIFWLCLAFLMVILRDNTRV